jgi:uncharacterized membrane protein
MAKPKSFESDFRMFFGRGLAILLPTILTLWIIYQAFMFLLTNVAEPINSGLRVVTVWAIPRVTSDAREPAWYEVTDDDVRARMQRNGVLPSDQAKQVEAVAGARPAITKTLRRERLRDFWQDRWYLQFVGLLLAVLFIYLAGVLLGNFLGRQIYHRLERLIGRVPGFKQVYPHVKQVVDLILGEKAMAFSTVVLVEYPSKDIWTLGFLTGDSMEAMDGVAGGSTVSVFVPTSPTPFTGWTIIVRREMVRVVNIPVDQALRFVLTAGVLVPERGDGGIVAKPLGAGAEAMVPERGAGASGGDAEGDGDGQAGPRGA